MSNVELKGFKGLQHLDKLLDEAKTRTAKQTIANLPVEILSSGKYQPRTGISDESVFDLAASIQSQGIIQPLIVRSLNNERYEIIAGERRWRAAKLVGLTHIPAMIRNVSDETALAFALIENIQREALNPVDEAISLVRLKDEFSMTHEEIAERVGRSRSAVTNLMRLLSLPQEVKELLSSNKIEMGHARALLSLERSKQLKLAQKIAENGLSVRESEKLVQNLKSPRHSPAIADHDFNEKINSWTQLLSKQLSSRVSIKLNSKGEGRVTIQVHSPEEIEWIIQSLSRLQNLKK